MNDEVFRKMLADQEAFNLQIFDPTTSGEQGMLERLRSLSLGTIEEVTEFLRTYDYKVHRRGRLGLQNVAHSHEELIDLYKYWLSLCLLAKFPFDRIEELYYAKSRVVQYRYQEEWLSKIDRPSVVVDIDNVLADYIAGICSWIRECGPELLHLTNGERLQLCAQVDEVKRKHKFANAQSLGLTHLQWQTIKHDFRTRGGKVVIPIFSDAREFLLWCKAREWLVILITSRPISEYPNIFTDTLSWLHNGNLPFDYLWWTEKKDERLEEAHIQFRSQIVFAVDDDEKYVDQYLKKGIKTYWMVRGELQSKHLTSRMDYGGKLVVVRNLNELMKKETPNVV